MTALATASGRRAIVVIANGNAMRAACVAGTPCVTTDTARETAVDEGVVVYGFDLEATGGGYVRLRSGAELTRLMQGVVEELRSQYLLGISPASRDGQVRSLTVRTVRPGLTVRARHTPAR